MKFLGILFLVVVIFAPTSWAGERTSIGGAPSKTTLSPRSSGSSAIGGSAIGGSRTSRELRRSTGDNVADTASGLAMMYKKYKHAVGVVVAVTANGPQPFATAWAVRPSWFATNSHITEIVIEYMKNGFDVFIALNETKDKRYRVVKAISHPRYNEPKRRNFEGKESLGGFDVGILKIDGVVSVIFPLADKSVLKNVAQGYPVAYIGFPMSDLQNDNINIHNPVATMMSGSITKITDYWLGDGGFEKNFLLTHDMGAAGGSSGSPFINTRGEVVGILSSGSVRSFVAFNTEGKMSLISVDNASMVNFAERVDLLNDILP